ncbi:MAG: alanine--glyoxylate aminotransferase [Chloroflexi bacterium HGW-Chloroflexi-3]|nr:MAG: alanine--glyoxylate aminotransferase [Chloroflexi bacterium HGW-Chloroflexi-3]
MTTIIPVPSNTPELNVSPRLLLGPGPSTVDPRILRAQTTPLLGHLDPWFIELMDHTQELLRYAFQTENRFTIPISGTGSAAMEAAVANMVEPGDGVLVCASGYFGLRLADMAQRYRGNVKIITCPWGQVFKEEEVSEALKSHPSKVVCIVHAETSTGAKQPLDQIISIAHAAGAIVIVDAVTSLGGIPLFVDRQDIDVCYSGSQKCLSCPPGMSPITLGERAVEKLTARKTSVPNWYLDLKVVQQYWGKERTYHHTAPISNVYGFYEALRIVAEEGLENRWQRHRKNAELFWNGLTEINLSCHVEEKYRLESLTTVRVPENVEEPIVRSLLLNEYNIEVGGGLGELKGKVWRVGLMGYSSRRENIILLLAALKEILKN